jgi:hypothetical protein
MKRIVAALFIIGFTSSLACADWLSDFKDNYLNKNIDIAVENAMKEGIGPDIIAENGLAFESLNPQNLVKALYCAGVTEQEVHGIAEEHSLSELIVMAGYKKSVEECGDRVTDVQPYTPAGQQARSFGGPDSGQPGGLYASPSTF